MFFKSIFDPVRIIAQIVLLQSVFYISLSIWTMIFSFFFGIPIGLNIFLSTTSFSTGLWSIYLVHIFGVLPLPILFRYVILRSKLCLDFASTLFALHLLFTLLYDGFRLPPFSFVVTCLFCLIYITVTSEYLCLQFEMSDIPVTSYSTPQKKKTSLNPSNNIVSSLKTPTSDFSIYDDRMGEDYHVHTPLNPNRPGMNGRSTGITNFNPLHPNTNMNGMNHMDNINHMTPSRGDRGMPNLSDPHTNLSQPPLIQSRSGLKRT